MAMRLGVLEKVRGGAGDALSTPCLPPAAALPWNYTGRLITVS